jgi:PAS domain-containing protein
MLNNASVLLLFMNEIPCGVVLCNSKNDIVGWNDLAAKFIGVLPKNILFKAVRDNKEISDKTIVQVEDSQVYLKTDARPVYDNNHNVIGGVAFIKEITDDAKQEKIANEILELVDDTQSSLSKFKQQMALLL